MIPNDPYVSQELLDRIARRRASIDAFLRRTRPWSNRLSNVSIVSSALAAVMTAGPAFGGETFAESVQAALSLSSNSTVWRTLCLVALVVSVVAAISTNLVKSQNATGRVSAAETCGGELEGLQTLVQFGQVPVDDAVRLYHQYVSKIPFVDETAPREPRSDRR